MTTGMQWDEHALARWLEAEADGRLEDADAEFSGLLNANVPLLSAPDGFVAATIARVSLASAPWPGWVRALVAASVVLMGVPLAWLQGVSLFALIASLGTTSASLLADLVWVMRAVASGAASAWDVGVLLGQAVLAACVSGPGPIIILSNLALAVVGFLGLRRVLAPQEECW